MGRIATDSYLEAQCHVSHVSNRQMCLDTWVVERFELMLPNHVPLTFLSDIVMNRIKPNSAFVHDFHNNIVCHITHCTVKQLKNTTSSILHSLLLGDIMRQTC
jgi:hypothetical protein